MPGCLVPVLSRTVIYTHRLPRPELLLFFCASRLILRDCPFWPVLSIGLRCAVSIFFSAVLTTLLSLLQFHASLFLCAAPQAQRCQTTAKATALSPVLVLPLFVLLSLSDNTFYYDLISLFDDNSFLAAPLSSSSFPDCKALLLLSQDVWFSSRGRRARRLDQRCRRP